MTNQEMLSDKFEALKDNVADLWSKISADDFRLTRMKFQRVTSRVKRLLQPAPRQDARTTADEEHRFNASSEEDLPLTIHHAWDEVNANAKLARNELLTADEAEEFGSDGVLDAEEAEALISRSTQKSHGVKYATTENNPLSRGSDRYESGGIDRFD